MISSIKPTHRNCLVCYSNLIPRSLHPSYTRHKDYTCHICNIAYSYTDEFMYFAFIINNLEYWCDITSSNLIFNTYTFDPLKQEYNGHTINVIQLPNNLSFIQLYSQFPKLITFI